LYTSEHATQMALQAIQCLGGKGYIKEYPPGRYYVMPNYMKLVPATSEIRRMVIGREIFEDQHKDRLWKR